MTERQRNAGQRLVIAFFETRAAGAAAADHLVDHARGHGRSDGVGILSLDDAGRPIVTLVGRREGSTGVETVLDVIASALLGGVLPDRSNFFDARSDLTTDDVVRFGAELEAGHAAVAVLDRRSPAEQVIVSLAGLGGKAEIHRLTAGGLRLAAASAGSLPDREP